MNMRVDVIGLEQWQRRFTAAPRIINEEMKKASQTAGFAVEKKAKGYAPVWRGHLRRSITTKTTGAGMQVETKVGTSLVYAKAIEFGRPVGAKMPPPGALLAWMSAKGIAATDESVKGTRRVRNEKGEITGSLIGRNADTTGLRKIGGYLPIEFVIARSIQRNIKKRPYLIKAFNELRPQIRLEFHKVPARVIARLRAGGA